eukprot:1161371-Pelagomonas_calceolata.AAC.16
MQKFKAKCLVFKCPKEATQCLPSLKQSGMITPSAPPVAGKISSSLSQSNQHPSSSYYHTITLAA